MNHLIDSDCETIVDPDSYRSEDTKHSKLLDILIEKSIKRLEGKSYKPRIRDALKAIQLKQKLSEAKSVGLLKPRKLNGVKPIGPKKSSGRK